MLAGSTPLDLMGSPAIFLIVFLLEALLYGGGAILIREIARGAGRGWLAILGLGLAFRARGGACGARNDQRYTDVTTRWPP